LEELRMRNLWAIVPGIDKLRFFTAFFSGECVEVRVIYDFLHTFFESVEESHEIT
jgi:hypothetical protein